MVANVHLEWHGLGHMKDVSPGDDRFNAHKKALNSSYPGFRA